MCSCSLSTLRREVKTVDTRRKIEVAQIKIKTYQESNLSSEDQDYWANILMGEIKKQLTEKTHVNVSECTEGESCNCKLDIKLYDDQETFKSWKVYVSGLSLGLIPIRFLTKYEVSISAGSKKETYKNEIHSWSHLFFVPVFFLIPNKRMKTKEIGADLTELIKNVCLTN